MVAVLHPTGAGSQIVIDRAVVLVGRSADCDAIIDFSSKISRMHCVLVQVDADYYIRDLGSMNGVRVNGERIEKAVKLIQGVEVAIGDVNFQFHANVQPAPRVAVRSHVGAKEMPMLVDESMPILDGEIIDGEIIDVADVVEDVEIIEEDFDVVEVIEDIEIVDEIDVIEDVEIVPDEIRRPRRSPRLR
jgi:pSer/pThr/pTyr-binding forkhead associated (FHA) protein